MTDMVKTERRGKVLEVTLDRPPANAMDDATNVALYKTFCEFRDDDALLVCLVTGAGERIFSAGWDLKAAAAGDEPTPTENPDPAPFLVEMYDLHKPIVAAVNGYAVGGAFELALGADLIIASDNAEFFLPEMQRGFLPAGGAVKILWRRIPYYVFMDMMLTGRRLSALDAERWGLVREVVPLADLMDRAREVADKIAEGAPLALQAPKEYLRAIDSVSIKDSFALSRAAWAGTSNFDFYHGPLLRKIWRRGLTLLRKNANPCGKGVNNLMLSDSRRFRCWFTFRYTTR